MSTLEERAEQFISTRTEYPWDCKALRADFAAFAASELELAKVPELREALEHAEVFLGKLPSAWLAKLFLNYDRRAVLRTIRAALSQPTEASHDR